MYLFQFVDKKDMTGLKNAKKEDFTERKLHLLSLLQFDNVDL